MTWLLALALVQAVPWHTDLAFGATDVWRLRVPLTLTAAGPAAPGSPVSLTLGAEPGQAELVGQRAETVRVCDDMGVERRYDLLGPDGTRLGDGPIPAGSRLIVPYAGPAGGSERLWVYAANPEAYPVPEFLEAREGTVNAGFEAGAGEQATGWSFSGGDADHRLSAVTDRPHGGARCLAMQTPAGTAPAWFSARQDGLPTAPGRRYRLTAWVRAHDVAGQAGWFVHIHAADQPTRLNRVVSAGDGTYDWRKLSFEFTAPDGAATLDHGSILYGTGTAWFDDVTLECLDAVPALTATAGPAEHLALRDLPAAAAPLTVAGHRYETRAGLFATNVDERDADGQLVRVDARRLFALARDGYRLSTLRVQDPSGRLLPCVRMGGQLVLAADLPARSRKVFSAWVSRDAAMPPAEAGSYAALVASPGNLLADPSFEAGEGQPAGWHPMAEGEATPSARFERVAGGPDGKWVGRFRVAPDAPPRWTGWTQTVTLAPGRAYLFMAWARTRGVTGGAVRLHAHLRDADDPKAPMKFFSAGPDLTGTTDWTLLGGTIAASPKARTAELFLTANVRGTIEHDGALLLPVTEAQADELVHDPALTGALAVWTENPLVKVFRDTPPRPAPGGVDLAVARGGSECLQLCLRSVQAPTVQVTVTPARAGAPAVRLERVGYVPCLEPSAFYSSDAKPWERARSRDHGWADGWLGWWPDWLAPSDGQVALEPGLTQPLWLTFTAPREATPGDYDYTVTVTAGRTVRRLPVRLRVWRFQLPERPSLQALIDLRGGPGTTLFSTTEGKERWWRFMAERRLSPDRITPEPVFKLVDGQVTMDATAFDQAATVAFDQLHFAASYFPSVFYSFGWGHRPRPFLGLEFGTPEHKAAYQQAAKLFWAHVKAKGWADRFSLYLSDEPHYEQPQVVSDLAEAIRIVREADPTIPVYSSTWGHEPAWDGLLNHWGIAQYGRFPLADLAARQQAGDKFWFTVDGQWISDTPLNAYERMLPYYCLAYRVSGYEFWALAWWTHDPYRFGWYGHLPHSFGPDHNASTRYPNGSGHLAYLGQRFGVDGPISTIRLEQVREGLEDYELFHALQTVPGVSRHAVDKLMGEVKALVPIPNAGGYRSTEILPEPATIERLRRAAGELLEAGGAP